MVEFANWVLLFIKDMISMLFSITSIDGFSMGYMLLAVSIMGLVISATIGAVALVSRQIKDNSYAMSSRDRSRAYGKSVNDKLDRIDKGLNG